MNKTFNVVQINETDSWPDRFRGYGDINAVYFYDPSEVTNLCELTPSYCLYWLYSYSQHLMPDDLRDELDDIDRMEHERVTYVGCNQIPPTIDSYDFDYEEDENPVEIAEEYFQGNCPV